MEVDFQGESWEFFFGCGGWFFCLFLVFSFGFAGFFVCLGVGGVVFVLFFFFYLPEINVLSCIFSF